MSLTATQRLLVIEDDPTLGQHLHNYLVQKGFEVTLCDDGLKGLGIAQGYDFDLILLDILLPGRNGLDILQELHQDKGVPVILLSALGEEQDRITGFTYGADDYLPKPFSMAELSARIDAVLRRIQLERRVAQQSPSVEEGPFHFASRKKDVRYQQRWMELTETEYRLLRMLWQYRDEIIDKHTLYQQILHREYSNGDRSLDMHISHIRRKLQLVNCTDYQIATVWAQGYRLKREGA